MLASQGTTLRLSATFRTADGALADPVTPTVEIRDPSNALIESGVPVREDVGEFHYDFDVPVDATIGLWSIRWQGTVLGLLLASDETFDVVPPGYISGSLITLNEYKALMGIQLGDTRDDVQITTLLKVASRAVKTFTGRNFDISSPTPSVRVYQYDGSGIMDIDDCTAVASLSTDAGVAGQTYDLTPEMWTVMPQDDSDVFYYLLMHGGPFGMSTEMGFTYNLDTIGLTPKAPLVSVTATWGWPSIPEDVQLAVALTVSELMSSNPGESDGLSAEAIEGWSRAWGGRSLGVTAMAIPNRARDLLANYQRILV